MVIVHGYRIYSEVLNSIPLNQLRVMGLVSVATPASHVGEPLAYEEDQATITRYLTLSNDLVIEAVREVDIDPLPGNLTNTSESNDWKNHSFVDAYLWGTPSRSILKNHIYDVAHSLETLPFRRRSLNSSALASAGYDPAARILEVEFASNGSVYRYYNVPESIYQGLVYANSVGKYYNQSIRGQYPSRRLL